MNQPMLIVPTISDLRNMTGSSGPCVMVLCYIDPNDGGGGTFYWDENSNEADDRGLVINPTVPGQPNGRWKRIWSGPLSVRWFGAQGNWDSVSRPDVDDYPALLAASKAINRQGGGVLIFPPGTYRINRYTVAGGPGQVTSGPKQNSWSDICFTECNGLHLSGYGATIDVMGNFHQAVDLTLSGNGYSWSRSIQPFVFQGCSNVKLEGFELNGNVSEMTRQITRKSDGTIDATKTVVNGAGSGIVFGADPSNYKVSSSNYSLCNLYVHDFGNDGIYLGLSYAAPKPKPAPHGYVPPPPPEIADRNAFLYNVRSLRNARDGMSIISLRSGLFSCCDFSDSGQAPGAYGAIPSTCGVDIEPEKATDVPTGDFTFTQCKFLNNGTATGGGSGLSASAGESVFQRCQFWGTVSWSISISANIKVNLDKSLTFNNPIDNRKLVFEDCEIYGACHLGCVDPDDMPKFVRCHFEDLEYPLNKHVYRFVGDHPELPSSLTYGACIMSNKSNVYLEGCLVIAKKTRGLQLGEPVLSDQNRHVISNCTVIHKFYSLPEVDERGHPLYQSAIQYGVFNDVHFKEDMPPNILQSWHISIARSEIVDRVTVDGPTVSWKDYTDPSWFPAQHAQDLGNNRSFPRATVQLNRREADSDRFGPFDGHISVAASSAPPTWKGNAGDIVFNQGPSVHHHVGWVWVTPPERAHTDLPVFEGFDPGWYPFGIVDPKGQ